LDLGLLGFFKVRTVRGIVAWPIALKADNFLLGGGPSSFLIPVVLMVVS